VRRIIAGLFLIAAASPAAAGIPWETRMDRAQTTARAANQPILIEFWATWCEGCKEMERDVYADERVGAAMKKVVPLKIDVDREQALARKFAIDGTPTLVVTDSYGREMFRYLGAMPRDRMLGLLDALPGDIAAINGLSARIAANGRDFEALDGLGAALADAGFYRSSSEYYTRALKTTGGKQPSARPRILLALGRNALALRRSLDAGSYLREVVSRYPGTPEAVEAARLLAGG
jgi:thiol-disulfide isomerase/thioredoxin